jgi:hypothetical protein
MVRLARGREFDRRARRDAAQKKLGVVPYVVAEPWRFHPDMHPGVSEAPQLEEKEGIAYLSGGAPKPEIGSIVSHLADAK